MNNLEGKIAVVTGASSGSGLGISRRLEQEGATVVMLARGFERLTSMAESLGERAVPMATDIADPDSVRASFERIGDRFGRLDILINNAGIYRPCAVERLSDDDIERTIATNFLGAIYTTRAAIPLMRIGGGDIINTSSEATLRPFPMLGMYVATKAALEAFGIVLEQEVRGDDIRVTTVVQGTAAETGIGGTTDFAWDSEHTAAAMELWNERGMLAESLGGHGGQSVDAIGDVHIFILTRPRNQKLDRVHCRST